jgi:hypothetical protein
MISFGALQDNPDEVAFDVLREGKDPYRVWFRSSIGGLALNGDTLLVAGLLPAMALGEPLEVPLPVSPELLAASAVLQDVFASWYREFHHVEVRAAGGVVRRGRRRTRRAEGRAAFFSGGADSFYTALTNQDRLTHLLLIYGFDIAVDDTAMRSQVDEHLRAAASGLGLELVEVETNLRQFSENHHCYWGLHYHGAALAAVGQVLRGVSGEVMIGSSYPYASLFPWGSHPMTDPLWAAGEDLVIVHDGSAVDRFEKLAVVAQSDVAMAHLRICFENPGGVYNCGRCDKCVRTMIGLRLVQGLDRAETLPKELDLDLVRDMGFPKLSTFVRLTEAIRHLRGSGHDPDLLAALEEAFSRLDVPGMRWPEGWTEFLPELWRVTRSPSG